MFLSYQCICLPLPSSISLKSIHILCVENLRKTQFNTKCLKFTSSPLNSNQYGLNARSEDSINCF